MKMMKNAMCHQSNNLKGSSPTEAVTEVAAAAAKEHRKEKQSRRKIFSQEPRKKISFALSQHQQASKQASSKEQGK